MAGSAVSGVGLVSSVLLVAVFVSLLSEKSRLESLQHSISLSDVQVRRSDGDVWCAPSVPVSLCDHVRVLPPMQVTVGGLCDDVTSLHVSTSSYGSGSLIVDASFTLSSQQTTVGDSRGEGGLLAIPCQRNCTLSSFSSPFSPPPPLRHHAPVLEHNHHVVVYVHVCEEP